MFVQFFKIKLTFFQNHTMVPWRLKRFRKWSGSICHRNEEGEEINHSTPSSVEIEQKMTHLTFWGCSLQHGCTNCGILASGLRGNGERMRKWWENEEMEREWGNEERLTFCISSFSIHFFPLSPFPTSKFVTFYCKMLNTALLSQMSQKS